MNQETVVDGGEKAMNDDIVEVSKRHGGTGDQEKGGAQTRNVRVNHEPRTEQEGNCSES